MSEPGIVVDEPGIVVEGVRRSFGAVPAVKSVSFAARSGAVTALVGPNGSGKTTLLLMLASLLAPDAGRVTVGGVDPVEDPTAARRTLGWMPDSLGAWGSLTARETLTTTARLYDLSPADSAARAAEVLTLVGLTELADRPARVLSRGQKQRLGLGRALVHDPMVLLLDEPASGLDPQGRIDLRRMLRGFAAEGRTVLVSSHILSELEDLADDAVFVRQGESVSPTGQFARRARPWRVRVSQAEAASAATAIGRALETPAVVDRRDVVVEFDDDQAAAAALKRLVDAGIPVVEFAPAVGQLEQTYLDMDTPS